MIGLVCDGDGVPLAVEVLDRVGIVEWKTDAVRYVGCASEAERQRAALRMEAGMERTREQLERLSATSRHGRYYSWVRLREKANEILESESVSGLWRVEIGALEDLGSPEDRIRPGLPFEPDEQAYRSLHKVEKAWRHIKSYLKIRPVYHRLGIRIRAHVLICFLAFYLVRKMELEFRAQDVTREAEPLLRYWDQLRLSEFTVKIGKQSRWEWQ